MVKVYVELVWDIHFPGKLTEEENRAEEMGVRQRDSRMAGKQNKL